MGRTIEIKTTMAKENKTMDQIHKGLLKKYHTLCTVLGLDDEAKRAILQSWGVESSRDLSQHQLIDICAKLSARVDEKQGTARLDKLRKQVIAAIGSWLRETGQEQNISKIKAIAQRASGYADFNKIPRERLRNLIATFNNKVKDSRAVDALTDALLMQHYTAGGTIDPSNN
ncbi:MAG: regulatory protein GemA [Lachnospiraceae bacterium]|nr:regulatory protein GemA [Lachnospiraceae bacterium]